MMLFTLQHSSFFYLFIKEIYFFKTFLTRNKFEVSDACDNYLPLICKFIFKLKFLNHFKLKMSL